MSIHSQIQFISALLRDKGLLSEEQKNQAVDELNTSSDLSSLHFEEYLINKGIVSEENLLKAYSEHLQCPFVDLTQQPADAKAISLVPIKFANQKKVFPIKVEDDVLTVALRNPFDISITDELKTFTNCRINRTISTQENIESAIQFHYGTGAATVDQLISAHTDTSVQELPQTQEEAISDDVDEASMVNYVNQLIADAYKERATDIHIEPFDQKLRIRYRIDGILHEAKTPQEIQKLHVAIISRFKVMSRLNISEKRKPQDGRCKVSLNGTDLDLRTSTFPTLHGEGMSIRLLNSGAPLLGLQEIGFQGDHYKQISELLTKPNGIVLVTGPTGSGKTTTLYSCIHQINNTKIKIVTLEDPIEYQMDGINQIQVNPKADLTFASGFRSILRQDPDVVLVGEIRDSETAEIAMRASLTGHLILSTLHTNNASASIARLLDLGIEPFLLTNTLRAVIAQRLVRRICQSCKVEDNPDPHILRTLGLDVNNAQLYKGKGCEHCHQTGYHGRIALIELLVITDQMIQTIAQANAKGTTEHQANASGMQALKEDGLAKMKAGLTTLEEIIRVLD